MRKWREICEERGLGRKGLEKGIGFGNCDLEVGLGLRLGQGCL